MNGCEDVDGKMTKATMLTFTTSLYEELIYIATLIIVNLTHVYVLCHMYMAYRNLDFEILQPW